MTSPESPFDGVPTPIKDLATSLADFVQTAIGIRPDYSPDTLSIVDHYTTIARKQIADRPELSDLMAQSLGAYFGEVVRRSEGAFWRIPSANYNDWSLCGVSSFVMINPIGVGYDALYGSANHKGPSSQLKLALEDRKAVSERLDRLPATRDAEYFTLCTRLELVQIVMEAVRSQAGQRGYEDMMYTEDDYSAELLPLR